MCLHSVRSGNCFESLKRKTEDFCEGWMCIFRFEIFNDILRMLTHLTCISKEELRERWGGRREGRGDGIQRGEEMPGDKEEERGYDESRGDKTWKVEKRQDEATREERREKRKWEMREGKRRERWRQEEARGDKRGGGGRRRWEERKLEYMRGEKMRSEERRWEQTWSEERILEEMRHLTSPLMVQFSSLN